MKIFGLLKVVNGSIYISYFEGLNKAILQESISDKLNY